MTEPVGFIGLGVMGKPMALNLAKAGFPLVVHSRSQGPVETLVAAGARALSSPADVARHAEVVITMLPDSPDVRLVLAGPKGVFKAVRPGTVIVDMSTISPVVTRDLAVQASELGATLLDAPVSGGEIGAINATLSIMVGGDPAALERVRPVLNAMGSPERVIYIGESGAGQICKACNQIAIGGTLAVVGEVIALARKAGVDPARVREALLGGFAASRVLEVHGERILKGNYKPGFRASLYHKDMGIALETARALDVPMPVSAVVQQLVNALIAAGRGGDDYSALATVVFDLARLRERETRDA
ncbi:MAG: 2-hydroxy-3-oxopropionate reductase [Acidobacteria bacterium]|nr:2-hydroxy-3-oxopropionate reductase [Acidobacteriota bacterium]